MPLEPHSDLILPPDGTLLWRYLDVTLHSNHGFWFGRSGYCTQTADFEVCLYSNRGQSSGGRRPHGIGSQVAVRGG
jgi:hypothetical protein